MIVSYQEMWMGNRGKGVEKKVRAECLIDSPRDSYWSLNYYAAKMFGFFNW